MAYRSSTTANGYGTTATGTAPAGLSAGDRLYASITYDSSPTTITPPANWVSIGKIEQTVLEAQTVEIFEVKTTNGTESYVFTSSAINGWIIQVVAFTGRHNKAAATISSTNNDTGNATPITIGLTGVTATEGADLLFTCGLDQTTQAATWGFSQVTNFTERQDSAPGDWSTAGLQTQDNVSAGATGTLTTTATRLTGTGNSGWAGFVVSIPKASKPVLKSYAKRKKRSHTMDSGAGIFHSDLATAGIFDKDIIQPASTGTKLYLRNTQTNGIGSTYYDLLTTAGASADTAVVNATAAGTEIQFTKTAGGALVNFVTGRAPVGGFTLTSADISAWFKEDNVLTNIGGRVRLFERTPGGSETEIGGGPFDNGAEFTTTDAEYTWTANVTDTLIEEDNRLVLKVYITNIGTMIVGTGTLTFNAADGGTGDSFINLAQTVTFKPELTPLQGTVRDTDRLKGSTLTSAVPESGKTRDTDRLKSSTLTSLVADTGKARDTERAKGAALTSAIPESGRARDTERLKGSALTSLLAETGKARDTDRLKGSTLTSLLAETGKSRDAERLKNSTVTSAVPTSGRSRDTERLKGAIASSLTAVSGKLRDVERTFGNAVMLTLLSVSGTIRDVFRGKGATLEGTVSQQGKARDTERLKGSTITSAVPTSGKARDTERLKGAIASSLTAVSGKLRDVERTFGNVVMLTLLSVSGTIRDAFRSKGATLEGTVSQQGKSRDTERLKGSILTSFVAATGKLRDAERTLGAVFTTGVTLALSGIIRGAERLKGAILTSAVPVSGRLRDTERLKGAVASSLTAVSGKLRDVERTFGNATATILLSVSGTIRDAFRSTGAILEGAVNQQGRLRDAGRLRGAIATSMTAILGTLRDLERAIFPALIPPGDLYNLTDWIVVEARPVAVIAQSSSIKVAVEKTPAVVIREIRGI